MTGRRCVGLTIAALGYFGWLANAAGAAPWDKFLTTNPVEADPQKPYNLSEHNGPWMIMAYSFSGENARQQAHTLVLELRKRYKLRAYVYQKKSEIEERPYGLGIDRYGNPRKMTYQNRQARVEEAAVLVGDFPDLNHPDAQATLKKIKYLKPDCLKTEPEEASYFQGFRAAMQQAIADDEAKRRGPMFHAMVSTNPLLPRDYYAPRGVDKLLIAANTDPEIKHSLLDCPGKYTVQVAHFTGQTIIDQRRIHDIKSGREAAFAKPELDKDGDPPLVAATKRAHLLCEALRIKGYEAYEFHDYATSLVCVGSFDSYGEKLPNGRVQFTPEIQRVIDVFKAKDDKTTGKKAPVYLDIAGERIFCDGAPELVHVPRRSVTTDYARDTADAR